ncbi:MAG: glycosyltransferase family 4 protein [Candidatus Methanofastidiosa archaeon]|nr:glycosyltransferase family 4 protein [Candidatus Methanofastidiosa archaeon]
MRGKSLIICVQYRIDPELIGGIDRYCWALDSALKSLKYSPRWFFPVSSGDHYLKKGLDITFIDHTDFLQGVYQCLLKVEWCPELMVTHFTRYFTKEMRWFKRLGVKQIISFEHLYRDLKARPFLITIKKLIKGLLYYRYCDKVAFVSKYVYEQALKEYWVIIPLIRKKIVVVYNGIDTDVYTMHYKYQNRSVLKLICACRIVKAKGLHILIDAIEILEKIGYKGRFQIDIYGEGQDKQLFIQSVCNKHLMGIKFLNNVNNLNELIPDYDIAVFPTFGEAHPFFVLESFACGLPIIASRIGGIPEMVNDERGYLVTPGSVEELKEAIIHCIKNKARLPAMGKKCREFVLSNFTLNHMINRHLELFGISNKTQNYPSKV